MGACCTIGQDYYGSMWEVFPVECKGGVKRVLSAA